MTAYNYETQSWVEGEAGARLRLVQLQDSLQLAESTRGHEYARFIGSGSRDATVRKLRTEIAEVQTVLRAFARNETLARELGVA